MRTIGIATRATRRVLAGGGVRMSLCVEGRRRGHAPVRVSSVSRRGRVCGGGGELQSVSDVGAGPQRSRGGAACGISMMVRES